VALAEDDSGHERSGTRVDVHNGATGKIKHAANELPG
jgi:hypothetical protein